MHKHSSRHKDRHKRARTRPSEQWRRSKDSSSQPVDKSRTKGRSKHTSFAQSQSGSDSDESSWSDGSDKSGGTRFRERIKRYAAAVIAACGCTFCRMYKHVKRRNGKEIVRAEHRFGDTFRIPNTKAKIRSLQDWADMLFWVRHHSADDGWRELRSRDQQFVAACLETPSTWSSKTRLSFAKHAVRPLWKDVLNMGRHTTGAASAGT